MIVRQAPRRRCRNRLLPRRARHHQEEEEERSFRSCRSVRLNRLTLLLRRIRRLEDGRAPQIPLVRRAPRNDGSQNLRAA